MRHIVRGAVVRTIVGLIVGGGLGAVLARRLQELLFKPNAADSIAFAAAAIVVVGVTLVASAGPAARAMRADPMRALRAE